MPAVSSPEILPYTLPDPRSPARRAIYYIQILLTLWFCLAILFMILRQWVPLYAEVFRSFRTSLPALTLAVLQLSRGLEPAWIWFTLLLVAPALAYPLARWTIAPIDPSIGRWRLFTLVLVLLALCMTFTTILCIIVQLPMLHLLRSITGP